jgi:hypothetical protein
MRSVATLLPLLCLTTLAARARGDTVTLGANHDNTIYSESGSESNGAGPNFLSGVNGMGQIRRGLISFDVAASVPAGATILSVQLVLHMSISNAGLQPINLHRLTNSWGEGTSVSTGGGGGGGEGATASTGDATWTRRFFNTISWTTNGGDYSPTSSGATDVIQDGFYTWGSTAGMVADVQSWLDTPSANFGWILINNETEQPTAKRFDSRQHGDPSVRPKLVINYAPAGCGAASAFCISAPNSFGAGALIAHSGSRSVSTNDFVLETTGCPPTAFGRYFFGANAISPVTFGNGYRCIDPFIRLPTLNADGNGVAIHAIDFNALPLGGDIDPGETWNFQFWYRNPAAGGANFNSSDALEATFCL